MRIVRNTVVTAACTLAFVAGALAQQQDTQQKDTQKGTQQPKTTQQQGAQQKAQGDEQKVPIAGRSVLGITVAETEQLTPGWRASRLIGSEVRNDADEKIGKINDLIIAPDGKLSVAIVDVGGFVGVPKHAVAVPVRKFQTLTAGKASLPGATKDELKKLPKFEYTQ